MTTQQQPQFTIDFDPQEIRAKYDAELSRRSRSKRPARVKDQSAGRAEPGPVGVDPYVEPIERDAIAEDVELLVIGGGFAGLLTAARAQQAGIESIRIIESAGDFGGVWYWNRYPNVQCDTEGFVYLPLLEETGYMPSRRFPYGQEILDHAKRIGSHFDLYDKTLFQTAASRLEWSDETQQWTATTDRGDEIRARYVMYSRGAFGLPRFPKVPGIESFTGKIFHASRWDYDYTGGEPGVAPTKLRDKKVAIIGNAASGVQVVSALAPVTEHLYVIQRTPTALLSDRDGSLTDPEWYASLPEGWQQERRGNFDANTSPFPEADDLIGDTWTTTFRAAASAERVLTGAAVDDLAPEDQQRAFELADMELMERARAYTRSQIDDPALAAKLEPWYGLKCKRVTFDNGYLAAFNRDNVTLVDAPGTGLEKIDGNVLTAGDQNFEADVIILATGFDTSQDTSSRIGLEIIGRDGVSHAEHNCKGLRSLHGVMTDGFPNLFATGQGQDPIAVNYTSVLAVQSEHIVEILKEARERGAATIEPTAEAVETWAEVIQTTGEPFVDYHRNCVPSYYNGDGHADQIGSLSSTAFVPGVRVFDGLVNDWRQAGYAGLTFSGDPMVAQAAAIAFDPAAEA